MERIPRRCAIDVESRDPYGTDAVLCQFFGNEKLVMYRPCEGDKRPGWDELAYLRNERAEMGNKREC